jgi:hypothetical protein
VTRRSGGLVLAALLLAAAAAGCGGSSGSSGTTSTTTTPSYTAPPATLPAAVVTLSTQPPPWLPPAVIDNGAQSAGYVAAAGFPYAAEMLTVHYHAHLDINVNGKAVTVPQYIGWVAKGNQVVGLAPLHTHTPDGIIHIENSVPATFVLGQFFIEWGVRFTPTCLGPYCTGRGKELAVFLDGKRYAGDPTRLVLAKHQEIAVEYGATGKLPTPPSSYSFPTGL